MAFKKNINSSFWALSFHLTASLFYLFMLSAFISAKNTILTGRMITTWYLAFHMGFIFLRLIQDIINLTPAKNWKFNETFAKFNNLVFISLIFPFALHLPFVYWLLFYYDSNLMLPNFVEISLPSWISISSHSAIALVALIEMTTTKYTYNGNHFISLIIMSTFSAGYIACLVGTYVQYGFWLYPIFHLIPPNSLPFVFSILMALLLLMFIVGKFIAEHLLGIAPMEVDKDDGKFPNKLDFKKPLPISSMSNMLNGSNDPFLDSSSKKNQRSSSSLTVLKKVLKKTVLFPFRSNIQKKSIDEKNPHEKNSYGVSNTEIRNLNQYFDRGDEIKSISSFTETKEYRINSVKNDKIIQLKEDIAGAKQKDDAKDNRIEKKSGGDFPSDDTLKSIEKNSANPEENILASRNNDKQMNKSNLSEENDGIHILNSRTNEGNESSESSVEYAVVNPKKKTSIGVANDGGHDIRKRDDEINPNYSTTAKVYLPFMKSIINKSFNNKNNHSNDEISNAVNHEDELKCGKKHNGFAFRFRLQLFPNSSSETSPSTKKLGTKENFIGENSSQQNSNSQMKNEDPKQENGTTQSGMSFEKGIQTIDHNLDVVPQSTSDGEKNSSRTSTPRGSFGKQKMNKFAKFFEPSKLTSKVRIPKYRRERISRNNPAPGPDSSKFEETEGQKTSLGNNNNSAVGSVQQFELQTLGDHADVVNHCGVKMPTEKSNSNKKIRPSTSKTIDSVFDSSCEEEKRNPNKQGNRDEGDITRHQRQQVMFQSKSKICDLCNLKRDKNHKKNYRLEKNSKDEFIEYKPEKKKTQTVEYTVVKCHKVKRIKEEKSKEQKLKSDGKIEKMCDCLCHTKEEESQVRMKQYKKHDTKTALDDDTNTNFKDHEKLKYKKSDRIRKNDFAKNLSASSADKRQNYRIPRTCEELLNEKSSERRSEKIKKNAYEKPRYEILPKLKSNLQKMNVSSYLCTSDKERKCKRKEPIKGNKAKNLAKDLSAPRNSGNHVGDGTKKNFVAKLFKFSKRTQKDDEEQLVEILKKCANGSKIKAIFATVPAEDKRQLNIDLNNGDGLRNFQIPLLSDDVKLYKFCMVLS